MNQLRNEQQQKLKIKKFQKKMNQQVNVHQKVQILIYQKCLKSNFRLDEPFWLQIIKAITS